MKKKNLFIISLLVVCYVIISNISFYKILSMPENVYVNYEEIDNANKDHYFGNMVDLDLKEGEIKTGQDKAKDGVILFKLFGFIPIKKVKVKLLPEEEVFVGGMPIGLTLQTDGAIVISDSTIDLKENVINKNKTFKNGDVIKEINGVKIKSIDDIEIALNKSEDDKAEVLFQHNNIDKVAIVDLLKNDEGKYRLGLWVRDDISGVGTLTFVKKDNYEYGALGHAVTNGQNDNIVPIIDGEIFSCSLVNIEKGEKNNPGELRCVFVQRNKRGDITKNTKVGIYGKLDNIDNLIDQNRTALLGGRLSVKPGKATIVSSVSGLQEEYEIEIIKASFQSKCDDKSIVFKVTDKRLLDKTGGIVQGMSGSPIIQQGKVIGAVTHVFISDPTKGYGVYSDWMLEQLECN